MPKILTFLTLVAGNCTLSDGRFRFAGVVAVSSKSYRYFVFLITRPRRLFGSDLGSFLGIFEANGVD